MEKMKQPVKLTAVGVGPGDPELITMKGVRAIRSAQLIFVPRSKSGEQSLALRIAEPWIDRTVQKIVELPLPMTRHTDQLRPAWQEAADRIAASFSEPGQPPHDSERRRDTTDSTAAASDLRAVYLLLGDPLLYGTFTYIWNELAERHPHVKIDIVPGVTSFAAGAARAQFVLSTTSDRVAILPASYETDVAQLRQLLVDFDTVILMKVGRVLPRILSALAELDLIDRAFYAERVGMPEERILLGQELHVLQNQSRPYLSLLIVKRSSND
jgi:precorrin-2/cobalt-factor-2 C20-methyltransferase